MSYMNLDASEIRAEAMPPGFNRGATDDDLETFLAEWESEVTRRLGELVEPDAFMRGILRDLAAAQGMTKIAVEDADYQAAKALHDSAIERLSAYPTATSTSYAVRLRGLPWAGRAIPEAAAE